MKLLIVDDEQHIIEYIKYIVDWKKYGFDHIRGTSKSQEALKILQTEAPDLLISDIKMPDFSGLDLTEYIVAHHLSTKVIILSGYSDFLYAQRAIRLGIVDYLIKPITQKDLVPVIKRTMANIEMMHENRLLTVRDQNDFFLSHLNTVSPLFTQKQNTFFITSDLFHYQMMNLRVGTKFLTIIPNKAAKQLADDRPTLFSSIAFRHAFQALMTNPLDRRSIPSEMVEHIQNQNWSAVQVVLTQTKSSMIGKQQMIDWLWLISANFPQLLDTIDISEFINAENRQEFFVDYVNHLVTMGKDSTEQLKYGEMMVQSIQKYIQEHYNEELSLDALSEIFHMHPVTISKNFKAVTGGTFSHYLAKCRMEAAEKLLIHSNVLIADISELVGYKTARYFSDLFRKKYGMTPQKYRRTMQKKEGNNDEF